MIAKAKASVWIACFSVSAALAGDLPKSVRCGWYLWDPYQYTVEKHDIRQLTGLDVQLVRAAFQRMGCDVIYDEVGWAQHQRDISTGARDIAAGAFQNAERASYAHYSDAYRTETDIVYVRKQDAGRWRFENVDQLLKQWSEQKVTIGIIDGFYYGPAIMAYINDPENASRIVRVGNDVANFQNLIAGKTDAFVIDRLVGATLAWRHGWQTHVTELSPPVFTETIHVIFSKHTMSPEVVAAFNRSMQSLRDSGEYNRIVREYLLPVLLGVTLGHSWFFLVDIIGTIAFAVSGVLLARQGRYSLFGAFVLAALPAVGGGLMRDIIVNRETPAVLRTPAYLFTVILTVLVCFLLFRLAALWRGRFSGESESAVADKLLVGRISNNTAVAFFDALGLAAFTVVGVIVAVEARCQPLWLWGPLMGAFTGAGGGILRDVIRADADNPGLKGAFYAEVALIWGLIFSLFLIWFANSLNYHLTHITLAVTATIIGGLLTRMVVFHFKIKSPMY
ncbi:MAG TPA: TRIC cation channel family protein [Verrucomicrobiota bacterium]|nr:TRIC cation channel family protein [Verrucomicrobiota bacterium]